MTVMEGRRRSVEVGEEAEEGGECSHCYTTSFFYDHQQQII